MIKNRLFNVILFLGLYAFWIFSQKFLENDTHNNTHIIDRLHQLDGVSQIHEYLLNHHTITAYCFIITTLMIDLKIIYYVYDFIINRNYRPMHLILLGVILRQFCQYINRLPSPENVIWFDPGFPTLIMNYNVSNDFFFSGHTLTALVFGFEMLNSKYPLVKVYAILYMFCEITFIFVTYAHYFMDIYGAITTYFMMRYFYDKLIY